MQSRSYDVAVVGGRDDEGTRGGQFRTALAFAIAIVMRSAKSLDAWPRWDGKSSDRGNRRGGSPDWLPAMTGVRGWRQPNARMRASADPGSVLVAVFFPPPPLSCSAAGATTTRNTLGRERKAFAHRHFMPIQVRRPLQVTEPLPSG